jgi:predicted acyltransferase
LNAELQTGCTWRQVCYKTGVSTDSPEAGPRGSSSVDKAAKVTIAWHVVTPAERVASVDALRGFDMFWIAGGGPLVLAFLKLFSNPLPPWLERQFHHAQWEGFTAWDLIMPLFMFVVGAAMPFSLGKRLARGDSRRSIYAKVLWRAAVLCVLGLVAQGNLLAFDLSQLHLYSNTLQPIAAGYVIAAVALVELPLRGQAVLMGALLLVYWLLMIFVPVPGHGTGVLTPEGNLALWIDEAVLGRFRDGTTYTWLLSGLTFGATVLVGVLAGHLLRSPLPGRRKVVWLAISGLGCLLSGWVWSWVFPIIKHIYSSSMVLWAGGWSLLLLALFYGIVDVLGCKRLAFPLTVIGMNAIIAYMAPRFVKFDAISKNLFSGLAGHLGAFGPLLLAFGAVGSLWAVLYYMYRKQTFLRI